MRCRECGLELDERDRLRNGAYQCPECGAIHHTATSSKVSPSPWRRKRGSNFASGGNLFTRKFFGLPLWGWLVVALALIAAVVLLVAHPWSRAVDEIEAEMPATSDAPLTDATVPPEVPADNGQADAAQPNSGETASTRHTGVVSNDFQVSFDWAMSYLKYSSSLTLTTSETGPNGEPIQNYSYEDWFALRLTLDPTSNAIRSAAASVQQEKGAKNNNRALAGMVSMLYGFDNSINANACKSELEAMIADNSRVYETKSFTAMLTGDASSDYTLVVNGRLK